MFQTTVAVFANQEQAEKAGWDYAEMVMMIPFPPYPGLILEFDTKEGDDAVSIKVDRVSWHYPAEAFTVEGIPANSFAETIEAMKMAGFRRVSPHRPLTPSPPAPVAAPAPAPR